MVSSNSVVGPATSGTRPDHTDECQDNLVRQTALDEPVGIFISAFCALRKSRRAAVQPGPARQRPNGFLRFPGLVSHPFGAIPVRPPCIMVSRRVQGPFASIASTGRSCLPFARPLVDGLVEMSALARRQRQQFGHFRGLLAHRPAPELSPSTRANRRRPERMSSTATMGTATMGAATMGPASRSSPA